MSAATMDRTCSGGQGIAHTKPGSEPRSRDRWNDRVIEIDLVPRRRDNSGASTLNAPHPRPGSTLIGPVL